MARGKGAAHWRQEDDILIKSSEFAKPGLVLLAGELSNFEIDPDEWLFIVAADGGARHALRQHVLPDHVVGDLDSLSSDEKRQLVAAGVPVSLVTDTNMTDGETAVAWALRQDLTDHIIIAGGLGGRFDHALGNLILLEQLADAGVRGHVTDGRQQVFLVRNGLRVYGNPGDQLSIIPLTPTVSGFGVRGVRWPLHNAVLHASSTLSISNEFTDKVAAFTMRDGRAVAVRTPASFS